MTLLVLANFMACRLVFGYLIGFAESHKADLGGVFWVTNLNHMYVANGIYVILMTGVLYERASTGIPAFIAVASLVLVVSSYYRFQNHWMWEELPFSEVCDGERRVWEESAKVEK